MQKNFKILIDININCDHDEIAKEFETLLNESGVEELIRTVTNFINDDLGMGINFPEDELRDLQENGIKVDLSADIKENDNSIYHQDIILV